jgi:hypothetical protein
MLVVNTYGTLMHVILETKISFTYRIPINGVATDSYCAYQDIPKLWVKNKRIKWLYK